MTVLLIIVLLSIKNFLCLHSNLTLKSSNSLIAPLIRVYIYNDISKFGKLKKNYIYIYIYFLFSISYELRIYSLAFPCSCKPLSFSRSRRKALSFNRSHISNLAVANAGTDYCSPAHYYARGVQDA